MNIIIDKQFPPFYGGNQRNAYGSFSCNIVNISLDDLKTFFVHEFARKVWTDLQKPNGFNKFRESQENALINWQKDLIRDETFRNNNLSLNIGEIEGHFSNLKTTLVKLLTKEVKGKKINLLELRLFLEFILEKWLINLENHKTDLKFQKREISERIIKDLFPPPIQRPAENLAPKTAPKKKTFCLSFRLWWRNRNNPQPKIHSTKQKILNGQPPEILVSEMTKKYENELLKLNILTDLFVLMDKICISLELNKANSFVADFKEKYTEASLFQYNLINSVLSELLFLEKTKECEEIVSLDYFTSDLLEEFIGQLGKYPDGNAENIWFQMCSQKLPFFKQQIDVLRILYEFDDLSSITIFQPFWNPTSIADDSFLIASWVDAKKDCFEQLFNLTSSVNRVLEVETKTPENISILQIKFGIDLKNIISMEKKEI